MKKYEIKESALGLVITKKISDGYTITVDFGVFHSQTELEKLWKFNEFKEYINQILPIKSYKGIKETKTTSNG